ncbi:AAA family ATPase, partial [Escherichia coli]|uniref:AAA family ATPase n=1 Tax=Escherichia coli TaxID=562 RepID=UPI0028DEDFAA
IHFVRGDRFALDDPQTYNWLRGVLEVHRGSLVLIDSLIRVHSGDENSSRDMAKVSNVVLSLAREFDCSILFTDHLGKTPRGLGANLRGTTE